MPRTTWMGVVGALMLVLTSSACRGRSISEADRVAEKYWSERLTNCNGSHVAYQHLYSVAWNTAEIIEYKNPSVVIEPDFVSEADRLNGLEWSGRAGIASSVWRRTNSPLQQGLATSWSRWFDSGPLLTNPVQMTKRQGVWTLIDGLKPPYDKRVDCAFVPRAAGP